MRVDELGDEAGVETRLLRGLKLVLVYVSVVVANRRWPVGVWADLSKGHHLGSKVDESLLVCFFNQLC